MKKILLAGLISGLFSAGAFAAACPDTSTGVQIVAGGNATTAPVTGEQCICDGGKAIKNTVNGGSGTVIGSPIFVKNGFDVQCSANTLVSYDEVSGTAFAVASGSKKGNQSFIGSSNGGAVTTYKKCSGINDACKGSDVTDAHGAAVTASSS